VRFYPQVLTTLRYRSVDGLDFGFVLLTAYQNLLLLILFGNLQSGELLQNAFLEHTGTTAFWLRTELVFSVHNLFCTLMLLLFFVRCKWGSQSAGWFGPVLLSSSAVLLIGVVMWRNGCVGRQCDMFLFTYMSHVAYVVSLVQRIPQVLRNFVRKNTSGFSSGLVACDLIGSAIRFLSNSLQIRAVGTWYAYDGDVVSSAIIFLYSLVFILQLILYAENTKQSEVINDLGLKDHADYYTLLAGSEDSKSEPAHASVNSDPPSRTGSAGTSPSNHDNFTPYLRISASGN